VRLVRGQAGALQLEVEAAREDARELLRAASARAVSPPSSAWPTAPRSAPDSAIMPPPSSSSQSQRTQACARCTFFVQLRPSSSHRLR
jgi:hypothetical protein